MAQHDFEIRLDADKLIRAYEAVPSKTKEMVELQMEIAVETIRKYASKHHRYTTRTGNLERRGISTLVQGAEGILWIDKEKVPYALAIHEGRAEMEIVPRSKKALRWVAGNDFVFAKRVNIPALKPDPFLFQAAEHEMPTIEKNFDKALQELFEDL